MKYLLILHGNNSPFSYTCLNALLNKFSGTPRIYFWGEWIMRNLGIWGRYYTITDKCHKYQREVTTPNLPPHSGCATEQISPTSGLFTKVDWYSKIEYKGKSINYESNVYIIVRLVYLIFLFGSH